MNIGFDIDGVLTNEEDYLIECMSKYTYENKLTGFKNPLGYETRKYENHDELFKIYQKNFVWEYAKNGMPRRYASEVIKKLREDGHKIYIITSRRPTVYDVPEAEIMKNLIKDWLRKNEIVYDGLYFEFDKLPKIKELKLDVMVEDNPITIPIFKDYTNIICFDNRYNQNLTFDNMIRVYSFYDLYSKILDLANKN